MTMAELTASLLSRVRIDRVWLFALALPFVVALFDSAQAVETVRFAIRALGHTGIFIVFAVLAVGYLKATGSEALSGTGLRGP